MTDRRPEAQTDYPTPGGAPRRRYPPAPGPGARAARAARAAALRAPSRARRDAEAEGESPARRSPPEDGYAEAAQGESPTLVAMVGIVALSVALIILLSFAAGYGFGRLFL